MYVGRFKSRLGMDALAIGASDHGACRAVKEVLYDQKYVDLKGPETASLFAILIATAQPAANAMFPGSGPMTPAKIASIIGVKPSDEERHKA